jgi:hypothetical protein
MCPADNGPAMPRECQAVRSGRNSGTGREMPHRGSVPIWQLLRAGRPRRALSPALRPGGIFAHVGVHPCYTGAFADRSEAGRVVIKPGYWQRARRFDAWAPHGVRARVGATHLPVSDLLSALTAAGLTIERVAEAGDPVPDILAVRGRRN